MDVQELIELIQTHQPDELTDEQISDIRHKLADSPELQQAMIGALSIDPESGEQHAPTPEGFGPIVAQLQKLLGPQPEPTTHPLISAVLLLVIAAAIVGGILLRGPKGLQAPKPDDATPSTQPDRTPATQPEDKPVTTKPATQPATQPTTQPETTTAPADVPQTQPAIATPPASFPLEWNAYATIGSDYESDWRSNLSKLVIPEKGAREPKFSRGQKYFQISGSYRLRAVPQPGRILRFDVKTARVFDLEFSNADSKVTVAIKPSSRISMVSSVREDAKSPLVAIDSSDDHYRWQSYRCYSVDVRYQDGRMMVCRGEVPLLSVKMEKPPTEGKLVCSSATVNLLEAIPAAALLLPKKEIDPASIDKTNAAAFKWTLEPTDKKTEEVELIIDKPGGRVSVENRIDHIHARASTIVDMASSLGVEMTVHVTEFHPTTTISLQSEAGGDYIKLDPHEGSYVEHTSDRKKKAAAIADNRIIGKEFWVRIRIGGDFWGIWISPDSKRWWRRLSGQSTNKIKAGKFGFELPTAKVKDKGPRRTTIGDITIRRFEAFEKLTDPKLVAKAAEALSEELLKVYSKPEILAAVNKSAGKNLPPRQWAMACNTVLAARAVHWRVRCEAIRDLLDDAIANSKPADTPKIMAAIEELSELGWQTSELGAIQHKAFEALARHQLETGASQDVQGILDASYMSPIGRTKSLVVAPGLLRIHLQKLVSSGQWAAVRREAMRAIYHAGSTSSWEDRHIIPFTLWALAQADEHLADEADPNTAGSSTAWRRSLVVNDDREMLNTLGEFLFLIKSKHYGSACKAITKRTLGDDLVSLGDEEDLLQSSHYRVRETIRNTPQLRQVLNKEYTEIGAIRLERARRQNDLAALKSLAVQFYGTPPGFGAMHVLADRDLSNGNFWGAAERYKLLSDEPNYAKRDDAAAKFRLAWAMLGRLVGKPADKPIALPGGTFSAKEFEEMVTRLAADRKNKPAANPEGKTLPGPEPRGRKAKLTDLGQMLGDRISSSHRQSSPYMAAFSMDSERLIVSFLDKLMAVDRKSGKRVWSYEPDTKLRGSRKRNRRGKSLLALAVRPLAVGDKVLIRNGVKGRPLTCFESKTGKILWSRQYDDFGISDPIMIGPWASVITASEEGSSSLRLHRASPDTGESSLSSSLVRVRDILRAVGRPVIIGDSILFRAEGSLVNCSIRGSIRWAKRLEFIPPESVPDLHADVPLDDMIVHDGNVIFSQPGNPFIMSVSASTGQTAWSFMIRQSARILGMRAGALVVAESDRIFALDPDTGKLRWRRKHGSDTAAATLAQKETLISVYLAKPAKPRKSNSKPVGFGGRFVRWISAKDGRTLKEIPIEGAASTYNATQIVSDGKRIFGLSNYEQNKLPKLFVLDIEN